MSQYIINGKNRLCGTVTVGGAKNSVLPILCACLLCSEGSVNLYNCPDISDVTYTLEILKEIGCDVSFDDGHITVCAQNATACALNCDKMSKLRSTALFLGAAVGRFGSAEQCLPGGCELGPRPIDMHLLAFAKMGLCVSLSDNRVCCSGSPHAADIFLKFPSVGATENIMLAAALGHGTVTITGAAREPEIVDLQNFINAMGGKICGAGTDIIIVEGVEKLVGINYNIIYDRIEAATYIAAALATDGEITVRGVDFGHISAFTDYAVSIGGAAVFGQNSVRVSRASPWLINIPYLETAPFPGFATDAQSLALSLSAIAMGNCCIVENIFSDRLRVAHELNKMGAQITVRDNRAYIEGVRSLIGTKVTACDLRSGAALVVAALAAEGVTAIKNADYVLRGYQNFDKNLRALGADIIMTKD